MNTLEHLQKEARKKADKIWNSGLSLTHNDIDAILDELITHVYKQAVQDCRDSLPKRRDRKEEGAGDTEFYRDHRFEIQGHNLCRAEADKNLQALLPKV